MTTTPTASQVIADRPGEKLQGRAYAHKVTLWYGSGWTRQPEQHCWEFRIVGHYSDAHGNNGNGKNPHFTVEHVVTPTLPNMAKEEMAKLLLWLQIAIADIVKMDVVALRRDLLLEVKREV